MSEVIKFSNGDQVAVGDTSKKGVYTNQAGHSTPVTIQGIDGQGGVTFTVPRGGQFYQAGKRAVKLNPLTVEVHSPVHLPERKTGMGNPPYASPGFGLAKKNNMNRNFRVPVAQEYRVGPGAGWVRKQGETPAAPQSNVLPWMSRGSSPLPVNPIGPGGDIVVLINTVVPNGYRLRISQYQTFLGPSDVWDDNLVWRLQIGSVDVFNPYNASMQVTRQIYSGIGLPSNKIVSGRPVRGNVLTPFTFIQDDLQTIPPGTRIQMTVQSISSWAGGLPTDIIAGCLIGSLWGDKD